MTRNMGPKTSHATERASSPDLEWTALDEVYRTIEESAAPVFTRNLVARVMAKKLHVADHKRRLKSGMRCTPAESAARLVDRSLQKLRADGVIRLDSRGGWVLS